MYTYIDYTIELENCWGSVNILLKLRLATMITTGGIVDWMMSQT